MSTPFSKPHRKKQYSSEKKTSFQGGAAEPQRKPRGDSPRGGAFRNDAPRKDSPRDDDFCDEFFRGQSPRANAPRGGASHGSASHGASPEEQAPLLPGIKPVLEILENSPERVDAVFLRKGRHGKEMERIVDVCRRAGVRFSLLDPPSFSRIYSGSSQGAVARLFEAGFVEVEDLYASIMEAPLPLVLALDQVQDPGNAGALARTLYALGGAGMIVPRHNGVYLGAAAAKSAAGALERLPVAKSANLGQAVDAAKKLGITVYGAAGAPAIEKVLLDKKERSGKGGQAVPCVPVLDAFSADFRLPAMLILGSEESGIRPMLEKRCDFLVSIPMLRDFDSLNVAQAGGIIISAFAGSFLRKKNG